jgi:hypothetical protein
MQHRINFAHKSAAQRLALPAGGRDETRHFDGTNFKPRKLPENAQTPTSRVHAVLGALRLVAEDLNGFHPLPAYLLCSKISRFLAQ